MKVQQQHQVQRINPSLDQIKAALERLSNPQDSFKAIHIAGTNGKGSVCGFLEGFFLINGIANDSFKVAKYTSPHINSYTERISINGIDILEETYKSLWKELFDENLGLLKDEKLTEFEKITALAFEYFKREEVKIAILEVGLGGRWDATNVIKAENTLLTAITNISYDHMDYLGDTLEKIRSEKEGIKKDGVTHIELSPEDRLACDQSNPNSENGENFILASRIWGRVLASMKISHRCKDTPPLRHRGRFEIDHSKKLLVDGAHNPDAALRLNAFIYKKIIPELKVSQGLLFLLGFLDKDYKNFIDNLMTNFSKNLNLRFVLTRPDSNRATDPSDVEKYLRTLGDLKIYIEPNPKQAFKLANEIQGEDWIVLTGSIYLIGAASLYSTYRN